MFLFYKENSSTLSIRCDIIKNLINKKKKSEDINDEFEIYKDDKMIYKSSYRLHYLILLSSLKCLKKYAKM